MAGLRNRTKTSLFRLTLRLFLVLIPYLRRNRCISYLWISDYIVIRSFRSLYLPDRAAISRPAFFRESP